MSDTPLKRPTYWLEGTATVPLMTRNKLWTSAGLAVVAFGSILAVPATGSPFLALISLIAALALVVVWLRKDTGQFTLLLHLMSRIRRGFARAGRWDEFDPAVEVRPFWLDSLRILAVSSEAGSGELAIMDQGLHFVSVLEVSGGGQGIQTIPAHLQRENSFQEVVKAVSGKRYGVSQLDFITRATSAMPEDFPQTEFADWVTPGIVASMEQLEAQGRENAQQIRSWVAIRMPVEKLAESLRMHNRRVNDESLSMAALDVVGRVTRLLMDHSIRVHRGLSPFTLAAVIRSILLPDRSGDDAADIKEFWDAWPGYAPTKSGDGLVVYDPATQQPAWYHSAGSIPRPGWPKSLVRGRWLEGIIFNDEVRHRLVMTSVVLYDHNAALSLAKDQATTASSRVLRSADAGKVEFGGLKYQETSASTVGRDIEIHQATGVRVTTRLMVSARTETALARAREEADTVLSKHLGVTDFWWDDNRQALGVLASLPLGKELPRDY